MKKLALLAIAGFALLINGCNKDELSVNYNIMYKPLETYTQWFIYRFGLSSQYAGRISSVDGIIEDYLEIYSGYQPDNPKRPFGPSGLYEPHYECVAKLKFRYYSKTHIEILGISTKNWQYAYGQFDEVDGRWIFRIFELYDEIPE